MHESKEPISKIHRIPDDIKAEIDSRFASGQYADDESVLREAMANLREFDEDVAKVKEAIDDWQAGDKGLPLEEAAELVRRKVEGKSG